MRFETPSGGREIGIREVIVAGWTGRDRAAVEHHIKELAAIGVAPPSEVPLYYRVSESLLSQSPAIQVVGADTSGEVEPLIIRDDGTLFLGLASDHTDRALESVSVALSKQICAKPVSPWLWPLSEVEHRLDDLTLTAEIREGEGWIRYQEGTLASIRPVSELIAGSGLRDGAAMLCGTLGALGGVRPASEYRMSLADPVLGRTLALKYSVLELPVVT